MNRNNNIFNKNEIENKLKNFKEGQDYSVAQEGVKLIYNFHSDWLRDEFGKNYTTVYKAAEDWDSDNFNHHREVAEYVDNDKGTRVTYRYEHEIYKNGSYHAAEWSKREEWGLRQSLTISAKPEPKKSEPNHDLKWKHNQLTDKLNSLLARPESDFGVNEKGKKEFEIDEVKKDIAKIEREKDNVLGKPDFVPCHCGRTFAKNREHWMVKPKDERGRGHFCSSQCATDKYPNDRVEYYTPTQQSSNNHSNLEKENHELCQQLTEVQKQLAKVLEELKELKSNIKGKDSKKLNQQIAHNERLIKNGENISVVEVQEQVQKSQALMKEFNTTSSTKNDKGNSSLPYVIGGSVILAAAGIGYLVVKIKKSKRK